MFSPQQVSRAEAIERQMRQCNATEVEAIMVAVGMSLIVHRAPSRPDRSEDPGHLEELSALEDNNRVRLVDAPCCTG